MGTHGITAGTAHRQRDGKRRNNQRGKRRKRERENEWERVRGRMRRGEENEEKRTRRPGQNNDNNYHLYASAVITCTRAEHAFNFVSNLNNSNKSLLPALLPLHAL